LANLAAETNPLTPLWEKYYPRAELEEIASRTDDEMAWRKLLEEVEAFAESGDPDTLEALDLGRRWLEQTDRYIRGDQALLEKMQAFSVEVMSRPETRGNLPLTSDACDFLRYVGANATFVADAPTYRNRVAVLAV
jgi:hypothetical protein